MSEPLPDPQIEKTLAHYGLAVSPALSASIRAYISTLLRWNTKISLTAVVVPLEILKFHFGESLFVGTAVPISHGRLADVGSGAGFPGLPLAMLFPDLEVVLIESNLKKATFLSEVIRELGLKNASVWRGRAEEMRSDECGFDFVTARALGHHGDFLVWAKDSLNDNGRVVLWLGEDDAMIISDIAGWKWHGPIPIPNSKRRVLLVGSPD
jgi:16S rRNA (guanine527-N7)-methyltransferase